MERGLVFRNTLSRISHFSLAFFISHFYLASRIFHLASRIFYRASRIFILHRAFFISHLAFLSRISRFLSRISHFFSLHLALLRHIYLQNFFLFLLICISNDPYRLPYNRLLFRFKLNLLCTKWAYVKMHIDGVRSGPSTKTISYTALKSQVIVI